MEASDARKQSEVSGQCRLCGKTFTKRGLSRHLMTCRRRPRAGENTNSAKHSILVQVEGRYQPQYWLYLEMGPDADWSDLDQVLHNIWLECCDHLSDFEFPERRRLDAPRNHMFATAYIRDAQHEETASAADADSVAATPVGTRWRYHYDFGSTTTLNLKAVAHLVAAPRGPAVRLLARNNPPDFRCVRCGGSATRLCSNCDEGLWCTACSRRHRCGSESLRPLINSPRTGVCADCGPSVEP